MQTPLTPVAGSGPAHSPWGAAGWTLQLQHPRVLWAPKEGCCAQKPEGFTHPGHGWQQDLQLEDALLLPPLFHLLQLHTHPVTPVWGPASPLLPKLEGTG